MKNFLIAMLSLLASVAQAGTWDRLTPAQQQTINSGSVLTIDVSSPYYWGVTYVKSVEALAPRTGTMGNAAVFWDLPGQVSYLSSLGLVSFEIQMGQGSSALRSQVTMMGPTPQGPQPISYPQQNTVFRRSCNGSLPCSEFLSAWNSTDPSQPVNPGVAAMWGDVAFEEIPGNTTKTLMVYSNYLSGAEILIGNTQLKTQMFSLFEAVVHAHANRMAQGATPQQMVNLRRALRD